jgi:hypothetical protein
MYSLFTHKEGNAYMVLRIAQEADFLAAAQASGIQIVGNEELGLK